MKNNSIPFQIRQEAISLKQRGLSSRKIAKELGVSKSAVNRWVLLSNDEYTVLKASQPKPEPNVLFLDIETAGSIVYTFGRFKQNITPKHVIREGGQIISVAWSWLGENEIHARTMHSVETQTMNDSTICATIYDLIEKADVLWAHNNARFDYPRILTRLLKNGFSPPKTVQIKDTLLVAKKLGFNNNSLASLAQELGLESKGDSGGIENWIACENGDPEALEKMQDYNIQDVKLLKEVYYKLRAFDRTPTGIGRYYEDDVVRCAVCGSEDVAPTGHSVYTDVSEFKEIKCNCCGHRSRTRQTINTKQKRANILMTPKS